MASVFIGDYHVYYSAIGGEIHEFTKKNSSGNYNPVENETELLEVVKAVMKAQDKIGHGYPSFICKIYKDGGATLPKVGQGKQSWLTEISDLRPGECLIQSNEECPYNGGHF